ncbi:MAG: winged helix-turn-helix transcriptional regulator [Candidatus Eremiobacteraeota bacterium]|nr:winged helix-turn-helix transcriptional regulator [Candidatus Eremiobacteraeota bacterium]
MRIAGIEARHVRFGFSEARECLRAIAVMLYPTAHAEQMPWVRDARRRLPRDLRSSMEHFRFFFSPTAELFARAWRDSKTQGFDLELRALRASPDVFRDAVVRRLSGSPLVTKSELESMRRPQSYESLANAHVKRHPETRSMLRQFVQSPDVSLRLFCDMLSAFHERVVQPTWGSIDKRLQEDIAARRHVLRTHGLVALLRTLGADISVAHERDGAVIDLPFGDGALRLDARARLVLVPSFFCWPHVERIVIKRPAGVRTILAYPLPPLPRKVAKIPDGEQVVKCCAALGDPIRLRIFELLNGRELSTRELAGFLQLTEPATSRHLQRLFDAGLVTRRRNSYFVMYALCRETVRRVIGALRVASSP